MGTASETDEVSININHKSNSGDRITLLEFMFVVGVPGFLVWALFGDVISLTLGKPVTSLLSYLSF